MKAFDNDLTIIYNNIGGYYSEKKQIIFKNIDTSFVAYFFWTLCCGCESSIE